MKSNEMKFEKLVVNIVFHLASKVQIDPNSYVSGVALQSCWQQKFTLKRYENKFWSGTNTIWENLKEGVWTLKIVEHKCIIKTYILNFCI
jgi:hypothetical protein